MLQLSHCGFYFRTYHGLTSFNFSERNQYLGQIINFQIIFGSVFYPLFKSVF